MSYGATQISEVSRRLIKKKYDVAAKNFNSPQWKAASQYRAGNYDKAVEILKKSPVTSENLYNLGNAQARQNQLEDALKSYQQALKENPDNEDAHYNKQIVEQALKEQQKQQQDENQESDDQSDAQDQRQSDDQSDDSQQQQKDQQQNDNSSQQEQQSSSTNDSQQQDENEEQSAQQNKAESTSDEEDKEQQAESQAAQSNDEKPLDESDQATEQWLRRIPDDPGRLLRRKFQYQYKRQNQ